MDSVRLMDKLSFTVHLEKSVLIPCQVIEFLGFIIDSVSMTVRLSDRKCEKIKSACADILQRAKRSIRTLARLIGMFVASEPAV